MSGCETNCQNIPTLAAAGPEWVTSNKVSPSLVCLSLGILSYFFQDYSMWNSSQMGHRETSQQTPHPKLQSNNWHMVLSPCSITQRIACCLRNKPTFYYSSHTVCHSCHTIFLFLTFVQAVYPTGQNRSMLPMSHLTCKINSWPCLFITIVQLLYCQYSFSNNNNKNFYIKFFHNIHSAMQTYIIYNLYWSSHPRASTHSLTHSLALTQSMHSLAPSSPMSLGFQSNLCQKTSNHTPHFQAPPSRKHRNIFLSHARCFYSLTDVNIYLSHTEMVTLIPRLPWSANSWAMFVSKTRQSLDMMADWIPSCMLRGAASHVSRRLCPFSSSLQIKQSVH